MQIIQFWINQITRTDWKKIKIEVCYIIIYQFKLNLQCWHNLCLKCNEHQDMKYLGIKHGYLKFWSLHFTIIIKERLICSNKCDNMDTCIMHRNSILGWFKYKWEMIAFICILETYKIVFPTSKHRIKWKMILYMYIYYIYRQNIAISDYCHEVFVQENNGNYTIYLLLGMFLSMSCK